MTSFPPYHVTLRALLAIRRPPPRDGFERTLIPPPLPDPNSYLAAFNAYHAHGAPHVAWSAALDFHHQAGRVISTETAFFMARRVPLDDDTHHTRLYKFTEAEARGDCWHVWAAAGDLRELVDHLDGVRVLTFHRHGVYWLKRCDADRLRRLVNARPVTPVSWPAGTE